MGRGARSAARRCAVAELGPEARVAARRPMSLNEGGQNLLATLKQALSRNKAIEKKQLWQQRQKEDHGSRTSLTLKSRHGEVKTIVKLPDDAEVTSTSVNGFELERAKNAAQKEDRSLARFCSGHDAAWRPDHFFADVLGENDVPWPIRPTDLFLKPEMVDRILDTRQAKRELSKKLAKEAKEAKKKSKKDSKKHKKEKDTAKSDKAVKKRKKNKADKRSKKQKKKKEDKKEKGRKSGQDKVRDIEKGRRKDGNQNVEIISDDAELSVAKRRRGRETGGSASSSESSSSQSGSSDSQNP